MLTMFTGPHVIHKFPHDDGVCGLTVLNHELYILRDRDDNQITVHSTIDFAFLHQLSVDGGRKNYMPDLTSCPQKQCLYVANSHMDEYGIHRLGLDGSVSKWPLSCNPVSMSVTRSSYLLVLCYPPDVDDDDNDDVEKLLLLSSESGECVRTISPQLPATCQLSHSVQVTDDQYLVCYSPTYSDEDWKKGRIVWLDGDGKVVRGTDETLPMGYLSHMALDRDGFLFVGDYISNLVLLFDPFLEYICNITDEIPVGSQHLAYDELTRRLYLGNNNEGVVIVQL